jgi:hypothetical protein
MRRGRAERIRSWAGAGLAVACLAAWLAVPAPTGAEVTREEAVRYRRELKRIEVDLLAERALSKLAGSRDKLRRVAALRRPGARLRVPRLPESPAAADPRAAPAAVAPVARAGDLRVNDRAGDRAGSSAQCEVSLAAWGGFVVAAWNDGETPGSPGPVGWAASSDGGVTWTDGGSLPVTDTLAVWESDPVMAVDERDGTFHLVALAITTQPLASALGAVSGRFGPAGFAWGRPKVVRASRDTLPDKPWLAADAVRGGLHVAYTTFFRRGEVPSNRIELQSSFDGGASWTAPAALSPPEDDGLVQGARPGAGPDGELHVAWTAVDTAEASGGLDRIRLRTSRDGGAGFGPAVTAATYYSNFSSGAPGYNRGFGLSFPGLAVDRSAGPYRGRVYVTWSESLDFYDDTPVVPVGGVFGTVVGGADAAALRVGDLVRSRIEPETAMNDYVFAGEAGRTVVFYMDSLTRDLDVGMRLLCGGTSARLGFSQPSRGKPRFLLATLPATGSYTLRVSQNSPQGGEYRIRTGFAWNRGERGRDQRDVFTAWSDDGVTWSEPVRIGDGPPRYDDWLPEIAVGGNGLAYALWYDWRETASAPCQPVSQAYFARSADGGAHWTTLGSLSSRGSDWSSAGSNLVPNQGDYVALFAHEASVFAAWADARHRDPDVFFARWDYGGEPAPVPPVVHLAIRGIHPNPGPGEAWVDCRMKPGAAGRLDVHDLLGRRLETHALVAGPDGLARARVGAARLAPGVYVVRLVGGGQTASARLAVVR